MKIPLDPKFITTTIITFIILVVSVIIVNKIAGSAVASAVGTVLGGIALKLFDKLDYSPTSYLEISSSLSQVYSALIGIFILYGSTIFHDTFLDIFQIIYGKEYTFKPVALISLISLDWGGIAIGGWFIGRIFSNHAMRFSAIAGFVLVISKTICVSLGYPTVTDTNFVLNYLAEGGIIKLDATYWKYFATGFNFGAKVGVLLGSIARAYVAIVMARVASRTKLNKAIDAIAPVYK